MQQDTGGSEAQAARFSTHGEVAKESYCVVTVVPLAPAEVQWAEPDQQPSGWNQISPPT